MYDIIIVGAGPAGLTAALYARRASKSVLVLEAKSYGGQIINAFKVENYPAIASISGVDYATNLYNQVKDLGAEIKFEAVERVTDKKEVITSENTYQAKAVILATGADNRKLMLENESKFVGKGLSYCATCDGNFFKKKTVAVVGGGNTALEDALYLSSIAKKVYVIYRKEKFRGERKYLEDLEKKENIEFVLNSNVTKLNGDDVLESIDVIDNKENEQNIKVDGLFIAIGQEPKNEIFANLVNLNEFGYIIAENEIHTNVEGIYVAGDARVKDLRQLVTAVSDGALAATTAIKEMKEEK